MTEAHDSLRKFLERNMPSLQEAARTAPPDQRSQLRTIQRELEALDCAMELRSLRRSLHRLAELDRSPTPDEERELASRLRSIRERLATPDLSGAPVLQEELGPFGAELRTFRGRFPPRPGAPSP